MKLTRVETIGAGRFAQREIPKKSGGGRGKGESYRDIVGKISRGSGRLYARRYLFSGEKGRKRDRRWVDCAFPLGLRSTILGV